MLKNNGVKRFVVLLIIAIVLLFAGLITRYAWGLAYLNISNPYKEDVNIEVYLSDGSKIEDKISPGKVRKRIKKGYFTFFATSSATNFFTNNKAEGFGRVKEIEIKLEKEGAKEFVGSTTDSCFFKNPVFISYICGASISNMKQQVPASDQSPPYLTAIKRKNNFLNIYGNVHSKEGEVLLMNLNDVSEEAYEGYGEPPINGTLPPKGYSLQIFSNGLSVSKVVKLPLLDPNSTYKLRPSGSGYVAFSDKDAFLIDQSLEKINKINLPTSQDPIVDIESIGETVVVGFGQKTIDFKGKKAGSIVQLLHSDKVISTKKYSNPVESVAICSNNFICVKHGNKLDVFRVVGNKVELNTVVYGVNKVYRSSESLYLIYDNFVIRFDAAKNSGATLLSFGNYQFLGISSSSKGLILTLRGLKKNIALEINESSGDDNQILNKLAALERSAGVLDISISGKYIYFTPDVNLVYDTQKKEMVYDNEMLVKTNQQITNKAKELGIPPDYQLISTIR